MFYYAQLDDDNICIGISQLSGQVNTPNMILLEDDDASLLGKKYNDGIWEEVVKPIPEPIPTEQETINASLMATMNEILLKLNGGEASV